MTGRIEYGCLYLFKNIIHVNFQNVFIDIFRGIKSCQSIDIRWVVSFKEFTEMDILLDIFVWRMIKRPNVYIRQILLKYFSLLLKRTKSTQYFHMIVKEQTTFLTLRFQLVYGHLNLKWTRYQGTSVLFTDYLFNPRDHTITVD